MNAKISPKHDNVYHIRKNYTFKSISDDQNECINYTLSLTKVLATFLPNSSNHVAAARIWLVWMLLGSLEGLSSIQPSFDTIPGF